MKKYVFILVGFIVATSSFAQIPAGYYDSAAGLTGEELKTALHNIIDNHTTYPYTDASTDVWDILKESDRDPTNPANVILIYTGWSVNGAQEYNNEAGWSREHVWAKSHGGFDEYPPAGTDAHHLRPADITVNAARGEKDFDNGGTQHSEATECYTDFDSWEPRPAVKGDVARMMFYMATRYEGDVAGEPDLELVNFTNTSGPIFGKLGTLIEWNEEDPVDDFERNRNEVVYSYQHNRNPFIDHPEWVALIWNGDYNNTPSISAIVKNPSYPGPTNSVSVSASVTDSDGSVLSVKLNWGLSSENLSNTIAMSLSSGTTYITTANIPAQIGGTTVYYQIEAMDNDSATALSNTQNYTVTIPANYPPVIANVTYSPESPSNNDSVLVSATITDSDGTISSALLKWKKGSEATIYEKQMSVSESIYQAYIPAYEAGKTIYFMIVAKDDDNVETSYLEGAYVITAINSTENEIITEKVKIFPNPVRDNLTVEIPDNYHVMSIVLFDIMGREIQTVPVNRNSGLYIINLSDKPAGSYLLNIRTQQNSITNMIILN
jgi:endonuclease I